MQCSIYFFILHLLLQFSFFMGPGPKAPKAESRCILATRYDAVLDDVREKVYTRDLFHNN